MYSSITCKLKGRSHTLVNDFQIWNVTCKKTLFKHRKLDKYELVGFYFGRKKGRGGLSNWQINVLIGYLKNVLCFVGLFSRFSQDQFFFIGITCICILIFMKFYIEWFFPKIFFKRQEFYVDPHIIQFFFFRILSSTFTSLLESGDLTEKSSIQFKPQDSEFPVVLAKICFYHHFRGKA